MRFGTATWKSSNPPPIKKANSENSPTSFPTMTPTTLPRLAPTSPPGAKPADAPGILPAASPGMPPGTCPASTFEELRKAGAKKTASVRQAVGQEASRSPDVTPRITPRAQPRLHLTDAWLWRAAGDGLDEVWERPGMAVVAAWRASGGARRESALLRRLALPGRVRQRAERPEESRDGDPERFCQGLEGRDLEASAADLVVADRLLRNPEFFRELLLGHPLGRSQFSDPRAQRFVVALVVRFRFHQPKPRGLEP